MGRDGRMEGREDGGVKKIEKSEMHQRSKVNARAVRE